MLKEEFLIACDASLNNDDPTSVEFYSESQYSWPEAAYFKKCKSVVHSFRSVSIEEDYQGYQKGIDSLLEILLDENNSCLEVLELAMGSTKRLPESLQNLLFNNVGKVKTLRKFSFSFQQINVNTLSLAIPSFPSLRHLSMVFEGETDSHLVLEAALKSECLIDLRFCNRYRTTSLSPDLPSLLGLNKSIIKLILSQNRFSEESYRLLGDGLKTNSTLQELYLDSTEHSKNLSFILLALKENHSLKILDMSGNHFLGRALYGNENAIQDALQCNRSLEKLLLTNSEFYDGEIAIFMTGLKNHPTLKALDLKLTHSRSVTSIVSFLNENTCLEELNLLYNEIPKEGLEDIIHVFGEGRNQSLKSLQINADAWSERRPLFLQAMKKNPKWPCTLVSLEKNDKISNSMVFEKLTRSEELIVAGLTNLFPDELKALPKNVKRQRFYFKVFYAIYSTWRLGVGSVSRPWIACLPKELLLKIHELLAQSI